MRLLGILWGLLVVLGPFAISTFAIIGIWGDTRWIWTALVLVVIWFPNALVLSSIVSKPSEESIDLDIPSWMKDN